MRDVFDMGAVPLAPPTKLSHVEKVSALPRLHVAAVVTTATSPPQRAFFSPNSAASKARDVGRAAARSTRVAAETGFLFGE